MKLIKRSLFVFLILILIVLGLKYYWRTNQRIEAYIYDRTHDNPSVQSKAQLEKLLKKFPIVKRDNLPKGYLKSSRMKAPKYNKMTKGMTFLQIKKKDCYKRIVGNLRIIDFICKDSRYKSISYRSQKALYLGIRKDILIKLLELKAALKKGGYNPNGFYISSGHRTPKANELAKGASKSRHIVGEAIDIHIRDIDKNGYFTQKDKKIVLEICEKQIIKNKGGIGKYPGSRTVHIDTRGYRARWNSY